MYYCARVVVAVEHEDHEAAARQGQARPARACGALRKKTNGSGIPRAAHDFAMVLAAARPLPLVPCKSWWHGHAALWNGS